MSDLICPFIFMTARKSDALSNTPIAYHVKLTMTTQITGLFSSYLGDVVDLVWLVLHVMYKGLNVIV